MNVFNNRLYGACFRSFYLVTNIYYRVVHLRVTKSWCSSSNLEKINWKLNAAELLLKKKIEISLYVYTYIYFFICFFSSLFSTKIQTIWILLIVWHAFFSLVSHGDLVLNRTKSISWFFFRKKTHLRMNKVLLFWEKNT